MTTRSICVMLLVVSTAVTAHTQPGVSDADYDEIVAQVGSLFGPIYEIDGVVNVDSSVGNPRVSFGAIEDPYGTLTHCYIFLARGIDQTDLYTPRGFVGVFKDGQIIWRSDTLISNDVIGGRGVFAVTDLNQDGFVDIVTRWAGQAPEYLWIFSWNGQTGWLLSDTSDFNGFTESVIISVIDRFDFVDVDGDGVMEIRGYWYDAADTGHALTIYSWNGERYGKWPSTPVPPPSGFLPRNNLVPHVHAAASPANAFVRYSYVIVNGQTSVQPMDEFLLERRVDSVFGSAGRSLWRFAPLKRSLMGWTNLFLTPNHIAKGESDSSFAYESGGLPSIKTYYARGYNPRIGNLEFDEQFWYDDVVGNSATGRTIGPATPPTPFNGIGFLDTIRSYINESRPLGWITSDQAKNKYLRFVDTAKAYLQANIRGVTKARLDSAILSVYPDSLAGLLTSEACALIRFNAEYVLNKLREEDR